MQSNRGLTIAAQTGPGHTMLRLPAAAWPLLCNGVRRHMFGLCYASNSSSSSSVEGAPATRRRRATTVSQKQQLQDELMGLQANEPACISTSLQTDSSVANSGRKHPLRAAKSGSRKGTAGFQEANPAGSAAGAAAAAAPQRSAASSNYYSNQSNSSSSSSSNSLFAPEPYLPGQEHVQSWVVFSDLHVSTKSLQSCMDVLRRVHDEARSRQAGVLFLGDFWDRRGDLPVIPLNSIQQELASWQDTPLLLLPGNHDQVDLKGHHHALHPVAVAVQCAHVFTEPTVYRDSLWLPYRRDEGLIQQAIQAAQQQRPLKAIFGHADVLTAHMNASYQARDGLPPELFPERLPVYLGHYHFPHLVPGTNITYIGSPYQVTASEAGQQKRLLLLDTNWQQVDSIPIDIGRKYFSLSTPAAASNAAISSSTSTTASAAAGSESDQDPNLDAPAAEAAGAGVLQLDVGVIQQLLQDGALRSGDLVHVSAEQDDSSDADVMKVVKMLADKGVQVQVHRAPSTRVSARIDAAEQLSMTQLLEVYADNVGMSQEVLTAAREALRELGSQSSAVPKHSHLELEEVTVEGFGPFVQAITYPLAARGVVAVTGSNRDDAAAVSNGAGKTSLLTSLLWAFKAPDGRRMTNADYINDTSKTARVTVTGRINTDPFELTRTASKSKSSLKLVVAGQDLTQQEQRLTEAELEARFSASLLPKTLVFTQEDLLELLQYGDAAFKKMLSSVVDTDCWESAREAAAAQGKTMSKQQAMAEGVVQSLQTALQRLQLELQQTQQQERAWEQQQKAQKAQAVQGEQQGLQQARNAAAETQQALHSCAEALHDMHQLQQGLQTAITAARQKAEAATAHAVSETAQDAVSNSTAAAATSQQQHQQQQEQVTLPEFDSVAAAAALQPLIQAEQEAFQQLQQQKGVVQELRGQLAAAAARRKKYERLQEPAAVGSSSGSSSTGSGLATAGSGMQHVCEQCLQPINVDLYQKNLQNMAADEQQLQQQLSTAAGQEQQLTAALQVAAQQRQQLQLEQQRQQQDITAARNAAMRHMAAESRRRAEEAEQRRREQQRQQQEQQALLSRIWHEERTMTQYASQLQSVSSSLSKVHADSSSALQRLAQRLNTQLDPQTLAPSSTSTATSNTKRVNAILTSLQTASGGQATTGIAALLSDFLHRCRTAQAAASTSVDRLQKTAEAVADSRARLAQLQVMTNPYSAAVRQLQRQLGAQQEDLVQRQKQQQELEQKITLWSRVESAFGRTGIPSFLLEGVLGELQTASSRHLAHLAAGTTLELSATSSRKGASAGARGKKGRAASASAVAPVDDSDSLLAADYGSSSSSTARPLASVAAGSVLSSSSSSMGSASVDADGDDGEEQGSSAKAKKGPGPRKGTSTASAGAVKEEISKVVRVQGAGGVLMERSIAQLSGGEKKRVALALGLGFAEVVAARGRLTSNVLVLDEVLEKLDDEGCSRVAWLLKGLPYDSVFVVGQAGSFVTKEFAAVDTVVKEGGRSFVELGGVGGVSAGQ